MQNEFYNILKIICKRIRTPLENLPQSILNSIQEIRLRINQPLCITVNGRNLFVSSQATATLLPESQTIICDKFDIMQTFCAACEYSVYAYQDEINHGYITSIGGCRIGVCGTAVKGEHGVINVKNISSLNIRIAREHKFCSEKIIDYYKLYGIKNTVIAGAPSSGKTTVLRDIAYQLSTGKTGNAKRISIVDERYEIAAVSGNTPLFDVGVMSDVLSGYEKGEGILNAVRTLNPQVVIFDEISTQSEFNACKQGFCAGTNIITSVHCANISDFFVRDVCRQLIDSKMFDCFVFLSGKAGNIDKIYSLEEVKRKEVKSGLEIVRYSAD